MEVKYVGKKGLHYHNIDWFPGDVKTVANDLDFSNDSFEVVKESKVEKVEKTTKKTTKKSSKSED